MSPARLEEVRASINMAAGRPGDYADRADELMVAKSQAASHGMELLAHIRELECKLAFVTNQANLHVELAHKLAAEKRALLAQVDVEGDRVEGYRFRAAQARIRNQRRELARFEKERGI